MSVYSWEGWTSRRALINPNNVVSPFPLIGVLNKVQYRHIASVSVSVSVSAETENVVSAAVSVTAVTEKVVSVGL